MGKTRSRGGARLLAIPSIKTKNIFQLLDRDSQSQSLNMWTMTSSVLLASILVTGLSLARPDDSEYEIPVVGTGGGRSQYYVLHRDGTFKYGYDTGDDAYESAKKKSDDHYIGGFGYREPETGQQIRLDYESGRGGFVATGSHIPQLSPEHTKAYSEAAERARTPFVDPLAGGDLDRSYGFSFDSDDHSRSEQSNADGSVTGSYSYVDEFGVTRNFRYRAGQRTGFVIEGDGLEQPVQPSRATAVVRRQEAVSHRPARPAVSRRPQTVHRAPARPAVSRRPQTVHRAPARPAVSRRPQTVHRAPARPAVSRRPQTVHRAPARPAVSRRPQTVHRTPARPAVSRRPQTVHRAGTGHVRTTTSDDGSYSFSYNAGDHEREESADSDLNVDGSFSFIADDGQRRTLNYNAGSGVGFTATGDHLPVAPTPLAFGQRTSLRRTQETPRRTVVSAPKPQRKQPTFYKPSVPTPVRKVSTPSFRPPTRQYEEANIQSHITPAGPYRFSYKTSTHSRDEEGDDDNNVDGDFSFIADDGVRREIRYEAGSDTGFIAEGAHIPVGPIVPGAISGQPTGRLERRSEPFVDPLANTGDDASYNFNFESETYSRSETADEEGNIEGTYTIVDEDGNKITYRFRAGKGIGFETEEISRSKVSVPPRRTPAARRPVVVAPPKPAVKIPSFKAPTPSVRTPSRPTRPVHSTTKAHTGTRRTSFTRDFSRDTSDEVFPGYRISQYEPSEDAQKFGYVLRYD